MPTLIFRIFFWRENSNSFVTFIYAEPIMVFLPTCMHACFGGSALCITKIRSQFTFLLLGGCYVISVLVKSISLNYDHSSVWVLLSETQSHYESLHGVSVLSDDDDHHHCQLTFFRSGGIFIQIYYDVQTLNANPKLLSSIDFLHVEH